MSNEDHPSAGPWTVLKTLQWTTGFFKKHGLENPRSDAEILLAHTLDCARIDLYLNHDQPLQDRELGRFKQLIQRRSRREPVAYITGIKEFWSLDFKVTPDVLIPRPETEGLVEAALQIWEGKETIRVLELGTGTGIISVALAHERPDWVFLATDVSAAAVEVARCNARNHLPENRIVFMVSHWFEAIGEHAGFFDCIVSNPPYICREELESLQPDIRGYEPVLALDGGAEGLDSITHIIDKAPDYLNPGGVLLLEIGYNQGAAVEKLGRRRGCYDDIAVAKDYGGHDRVARLVLTTAA